LKGWSSQQHVRVLVTVPVNEDQGGSSADWN
jgi:hypothetical protein